MRKSDFRKIIFGVVGILCFGASGIVQAEQAADAEKFVKIGQGDLKLCGYVQSYYACYFEETTKNATFKINRARLDLMSRITDEVSARIQIDPAVASSILLDAYLKYALPYNVTITTGQFKIPFCEELLTSSADLDTIETSEAAKNLAQSYDIGAVADGKFLGDMLYAAAGGINGTDKNTADTNDNKDLVGRLVITPFKGSKNPLEGLALGAAGQAGKQALSGTNVGNRHRLDGMLKYKYKNFKLLAEYLFQRSEQTDESTKDSEGWYALMTYKIFSVLQGVLKYEQYEPNRSVGQDRKAVATIGCDFYLNDYTKLQANYRLKDNENTSTTDTKEFLLQAQVKF
jgi:hypothetical protein